MCQTHLLYFKTNKTKQKHIKKQTKPKMKYANIDCYHHLLLKSLTYFRISFINVNKCDILTDAVRPLNKNYFITFKEITQTSSLYHNKTICVLTTIIHYFDSCNLITKCQFNIIVTFGKCHNVADHLKKGKEKMRHCQLLIT